MIGQCLSTAAHSRWTPLVDAEVHQPTCDNLALLGIHLLRCNISAIAPQKYSFKSLHIFTQIDSQAIAASSITPDCIYCRFVSRSR